MSLDYYSKPDPKSRVLVSFTPTGKAFRIAYCRPSEFHLSIPTDDEHSRFGRWEEICSDLDHLDLTGSLPRSSSGRCW